MKVPLDQEFENKNSKISAHIWFNQANIIKTQLEEVNRLIESEKILQNENCDMSKKIVSLE